jgi:hypothetical protein
MEKVMITDVLPAKPGTFTPDITRLEETTAPLPAELRKFLEAYGDGRYAIEGLNTSVKSLVEAHARTEGKLPAGWHLVGIAEDEPYQDLFLICQEGRPQRLSLFPSVYGRSFDRLRPEREYQLADSLTSYLLAEHYRHLWSQTPWRAMLWAKAENVVTLETVMAASCAAGLRLFALDNRHSAGRRRLTAHNRLIGLAHRTERGIRLVIGSHDKEAVQNCARTITKTTKLKFSQSLIHHPCGDLDIDWPTIEE